MSALLWGMNNNLGCPLEELVVFSVASVGLWSTRPFIIVYIKVDLCVIVEAGISEEYVMFLVMCPSVLNAVNRGGSYHSTKRLHLS